MRPIRPALRSTSRQLDVAIDLKFEVDAADRDNRLRRQCVAALRQTSISRCAATPSFLRNSLLARRLAHALPGRLVLPQPFERALTDQPVGGPAAELDLAHQLRMGPPHA